MCCWVTSCYCDNYIHLLCIWRKRKCKKLPVHGNDRWYYVHDKKIIKNHCMYIQNSELSTVYFWCVTEMLLWFIQTGIGSNDFFCYLKTQKLYTQNMSNIRLHLTLIYFLISIIFKENKAIQFPFSHISESLLHLAFIKQTHHPKGLVISYEISPGKWSI